LRAVGPTTRRWSTIRVRNGVLAIAAAITISEERVSLGTFYTDDFLEIYRSTTGGSG
jgi:hypothetical protein